MEPVVSTRNLPHFTLSFKVTPTLLCRTFRTPQALALAFLLALTLITLHAIPSLAPAAPCSSHTELFAAIVNYSLSWIRALHTQLFFYLRSPTHIICLIKFYSSGLSFMVVVFAKAFLVAQAWTGSSFCLDALWYCVTPAFINFIVTACFFGSCLHWSITFLKAEFLRAEPMTVPSTECTCNKYLLPS